MTKGKKPKGWRGESGRHAAARRGIKTAIQTIKHRKFGAVGKPVYDIASLEDTLVILEDLERTGMDMSGNTNDVLDRAVSYYEDEHQSEQRDFDLAVLEDTKDILNALSKRVTRHRFTDLDVGVYPSRNPVEDLIGGRVKIRKRRK